MSVSNEPFRRFMRSFTLFEKSPADFYVLSDILRYQDRVFLPPAEESDVASGRVCFHIFTLRHRSCGDERTHKTCFGEECRESSFKWCSSRTEVSSP